MGNYEKALEFLKQKYSESAYFQRKPWSMEYRINHSIRTANIGRLIAKEEGMNEEALAIGCLLHDISYALDFSSKEEMIKLLPNHRWSGIQRQASKLGYTREWDYKYISVQGYLIDCTDRKNKKEIHRQVYEQYHNIKLTKHDIIHHIDGNKLNNNPDNLVCITRAEHVRLHKPRIKR